VIQKVKELATELKILVFANGKLFKDGEIQIVKTRSMDLGGRSAQWTQVRLPQCGRDRRIDKCRLVEEMIDPVGALLGIARDVGCDESGTT